ncbi:MAG: DapH/DapD/GlmU-related protein [Candidatus Eisenbacteria bacterium]|nr:DapH/DapD/GlmU-related protein [Candidatus Eisenbacteria bacterium]
MKTGLGKLIRIGAGFMPFSGLRTAFFALGGVRVGRGAYLGYGVRIGERTALGESVRICSGASIGRDVSIGGNAKIGVGARIGDGTVVGQDVVVSEFALVGNAVIGKGSFIERGVVMTGFKVGKISIGKHTYIGLGAVLDWSGGLEIGDYVQIAGPSVGIWTHSSVFQALKGKELNDRSETVISPVKIDDNVWIGGNSTVYPGSIIGPFAVVLPNSVVNRNVARGTVVGGNPATVKRTLLAEGSTVRFSGTEGPQP